MVLASSSGDCLFLYRGSVLRAESSSGSEWEERQADPVLALLGLGEDREGPQLCLVLSSGLSTLRFSRQLDLLSRRSLRLPLAPPAQGPVVLAQLPALGALLMGAGSRLFLARLGEEEVVELPVTLPSAGVRDAVSLRGELRVRALRPLRDRAGRPCLLVLAEREPPT